MDENKIIEFLEEKGVELVGKLNESLPRETDATGNLRHSIRFEVKKTAAGGYTFDLYLLDYYREVDQGQQPGHRPPIKDLEGWITAKRLVINPKSNTLERRLPKSKLKPISEDTMLLKQVAEAIQTKIFKKGTKGTRFYSSVVPQWVENFKKDISIALKDYVISDLRADEHELNFKEK